MTMIEVSVSAVVFSMILFAVNVTISGSEEATKTTSVWLDLNDSLRGVLRRMSEELRGASRHGEDTNSNTLLDATEDRNGNSRLEADWSVTRNSITFNRYLSDGTISTPITYRLRAGNLERVSWELDSTVPVDQMPGSPNAGTSPTPTQGGTCPTPTQGGTSPTPTQGGTSPTPNQGGTSPTPNQGGTSPTPNVDAPAPGGMIERISVMASSVSAFTVVETGSKLTITIGISKVKDTQDGTMVDRFQSISVTPRN